MKLINNKKKRILIYGGSFSPFHSAHLHILKSAIKTFDIYKTYIVPTYHSPFKVKNIISQKSRLEIIKIATKSINNVVISNYELRQKTISYTYKTVNYFKNKFNKCELYFLIGADNVVNFHKWKNAKQISKNINIIVAPRENFSLNEIKDNISKYNMKILNTKLKNKSSSNINFSLYSINSGLSKDVMNYVNNNPEFFNIRTQSMSRIRYNHCFRTANFARKIAIKNNLNKKSVHEVYIAGLYHDFAKEYSDEKLLKIANENNINNYASVKTLHGPVASIILRKKFCFSNENILNAIYYHTEPFLNNHKPSIIDKIVYCADKLEPYRKNESWIKKDYKKICNLSLNNINKAFIVLNKYVKNKIKESIN